MPTVIDSLVVTLGLDPEDWIKGNKEAEKIQKKTKEGVIKSGKEMEAGAKQLAGFFGGIQKQVLGLTAAYLGVTGIKNFIEKINATDAATGRLATNLDVSTEALAAWEGVAKKFGSSGADIDSAFRNISNIMAEINATGTSSSLGPLARIGVDINEFVSKSSTAESRLRQIQAALSKMSPQQAQFWGKQLGLSEETVNMLRETNGQMDELLKKQRAMYEVSRYDTEMAKQRAKAWSDISDAITGAARRLLDDWTPGILAVSNGVKSLFTFTQEHPITFGSMLSSANPVLAVIVEIVDYLMKAAGLTHTIGEFFGFGPKKPVGASNGGQEEDIAKLMKMGWSREQATGISANIVRESSGDHTNVGDNGQAYGLAQWHPDRQRDFKMWAGKDIRQSSRDEQLAFINYELRQGKEVSAGAALSRATSAGDAASIISKQYERPKNIVGEANHRANLASRMFARGAGTQVTGGSSSSTEVKIGQINVQTQATDANGIAKDIGPAIKNSAFVSQANVGLN